ncbi:hypothetical protein EHS25_002612 [Saitozyma podzolica]|uniref:Uncharacterized protein n=1 Tax=Saitozyma podzolica TaxID=1890683 RepID=A0A427YCU4_9TREE|nr:hypothetical protein EHS25_002612 [Saitozyma podzolica]
MSMSMSRPSSFSSLLFLALCACALLGQCLAATTDQQCLDACSDYSISIGHCRDVYGNEPEYQNYTDANAFVACLCTGAENDGASFGNASIQASVGICESCASTPEKIKEDLSALLSLCTIQLQNGSAADALSFRPQSYKTAESPDVASIVDTTSGSVRRLHAATIWVQVGVATVISAVVVTLGLGL